MEKSYVEGPQRRWPAGTEKSRRRFGSGKNGEVGRSKIPQGHTGHVKDFGLYTKSNTKRLWAGYDIIRFLLLYAATLSRNIRHASYITLNFLLSSSYKKVNINR